MADYVELEELKRSLELAGEAYADDDLALAITAASAAIDSQAGRRFSLDAADVTREYLTSRVSWVELDDITAVSGVSVCEYGETTWTDLTPVDDYALLPRNATADGWPTTALELLPTGSVVSFDPTGEGRWSRVRVTGRFGWATVPESIKAATMILATRFVKRVREAPFGVAGMGADGIAVRIASGDPDVAMLTSPYTRPTRLA